MLVFIVVGFFIIRWFDDIGGNFGIMGMLLLLCNVVLVMVFIVILLVFFCCFRCCINFNWL